MAQIDANFSVSETGIRATEPCRTPRSN